MTADIFYWIGVGCSILFGALGLAIVSAAMIGRAIDALGFHRHFVGWLSYELRRRRNQKDFPG